MTDASTNGLYAKYDVQRIADPRGRHNECEYFVLDLTHDPIARYAAKQYAFEAKSRGYKQLSADLYALVAEAEEKG